MTVYFCNERTLRRLKALGVNTDHIVTTLPIPEKVHVPRAIKPSDFPHGIPKWIRDIADGGVT